MILKCENKGAIDIYNNWTVNGRTKHIDTRNYFLRELKEKGIIESRQISGDDNSTNIFTKNLIKSLFTKYASYYCTNDEFEMTKQERMLQEYFTMLHIIVT